MEKKGRMRSFLFSIANEETTPKILKNEMLMAGNKKVIAKITIKKPRNDCVFIGYTAEGRKNASSVNKYVAISNG